MKKPVYPHSPIGSIDALASALSISPALLNEIAKNADSYYRANKPKQKSSGGVRQTYTVLQPLRQIQEAIQARILQEVSFPDYIFAVKNDVIQRDYVNNAGRHVGQSIVVREDIKDFFPSTNASVIHNVWQQFFNFPYEVASIVTRLTTLNGFLPQGSCTSSYLASLVLWEHEPLVEYRLRSIGFVYTRYADDITISSFRKIKINELKDIKAQIYGMLRCLGLKQNAKKARNGISTRGHRQTVTGLNVSSGRTTLPKDERKRIRAEIFRFTNANPNSFSIDERQKIYDHLKGRVAHLGQFHPKQANKLQKDLETFMILQEYA